MLNKRTFLFFIKNSEVPKLPEFLVEKDDEYDEDLRSRRNEDSTFATDDTDDDADDEDADEKRMRREAMRQSLEEETERSSRAKKSNTPKIVPPPTLNIDNPYESDETSYFIPILVAIGAFIPLLFCLCRI